MQDSRNKPRKAPSPRAPAQEETPLLSETPCQPSPEAATRRLVRTKDEETPMKPGLCHLVGTGQAEEHVRGQLHVEGDLLAGLSQACGFRRCCFRWQGRRQGSVGTKSFLDLDVLGKPSREDLEVRTHAVHVTTGPHTTARYHGPKQTPPCAGTCSHPRSPSPVRPVTRIVYLWTCPPDPPSSQSLNASSSLRPCSNSGSYQSCLPPSPPPRPSTPSLQSCWVG